jgi:hypothetical protein
MGFVFDNQDPSSKKGENLKTVNCAYLMKTPWVNSEAAPKQSDEKSDCLGAVVDKKTHI